MSERQPLSEEAIDALVRAHLQQQAQDIDPRPALARLQAEVGEGGEVSDLGDPGTKTPGPEKWPRFASLRFAKRWAWVVAAAAAFALAFWLGGAGQPKQASAETLVRAAKDVHALPLDRCYLVELKRESDAEILAYPLLAQSRIILWSRGDRFWVEAVLGQRRFVWGRDEEGSLWLALSAQAGLRFEASEVPERLAAACDLCSLRMESDLKKVLQDFDLRREPSLPGAATDVVRAELKPGRAHPFLRDVVLEIDRETKVIRRMALARQLRGRPVATVTFTLVDSQAQDDSRYQLEGHLTPPFQIYSRSFEPQRRPLLLLRHLGPRASDAETKSENKKD